MINQTIGIAVICAFAIATGSSVWAKKGGGGSNADYRSAKNGQYVKKDYAQRNQSTTVREERR